VRRRKKRGNTLCPFVEKPFDDCYVRRLSSYTIKDVVEFCGKNYDACKIYRFNNGIAEGIDKGNEQTAIIQ
jgi:hypothetical protein